MTYQTICCVGDSIANGYWCDRGLGWFGRLQERIARAAPKQFGFNNLAQSGDRSWDVYHRICGEVLTRRPDMLIIAVGINDLIRWQSADGPTDQSPTARAEAWHKILDVVSRHFTKTLVVGLLPSVESRYPCTGWDDVTPMWHRNADTRAYNDDIARWSTRAGVAYLDIFSVFESRDYASLFEDGGHPTGAGHQVICDSVFAKLQDLGWVHIGS